jgi:hypothetical protein
MIDFFDTDYCSGSAAIYDSHITFSKNMVKYFQEAYKARVGVDKENKLIYVYPLNKDTALSGEISETSLLSISISKTYARICSRALVGYLSNIFNLVIGKKEFVRYSTSYDDLKKAIVIDMGGQL